MFRSDRSYKIHWELTDLCNLKCPMCPRTAPLDHCRPVKEIERSQFFLEDVKNCFPERFLKNLGRIDFCGNFGDPCMARDFYSICAFLMQVHRIPVMVSTNGGMRSPAWWQKLGRLFAGSPSWIEFHIDGLRDTHALYRIGADWDRVMANAAAFIAAGGRADWHFILFKHNQHQLEAAADIARRMGFTYFVPTDTGRFPNNGVIRYQHPDGDWRELKQSTLSSQSKFEKVALQPSIHGAETFNKTDPAVSAIQSDHSDPSGEITCKASRQNRFFLDSRGYIAPCCWVSNRDHRRPGNMLRAISLAGRDPEDFNIHKRSIEKILRDKLFTEVFPALWQAGQLSTCQKKCGRRHRNIKKRIKL